MQTLPTPIAIRPSIQVITAGSVIGGERMREKKKEMKICPLSNSINVNAVFIEVSRGICKRPLAAVSTLQHNIPAGRDRPRMLTH